MTTPVDRPSPLVTIAIPTYNRAHTFLATSLRAACAQQYERLEILVADNASTDGTPDLVASFSDPRIRYQRHPKNGGPDYNINYCIQAARGDYTLLLMDDDSIDPDFIESCMAAARARPEAGLIRTGTRVLDSAGAQLYESTNQVAGLDFADFIVAWTQGRTAPFLCSTLFRSAPLREIGMRSRYFLWADVLTELPIAARHGRVDIEQVKATFCLHPGELTVKATIEQWCEESLELLALACSLAPEHQARIREALVPFLASHNYRLALRVKLPMYQRLQACLKVARAFGMPREPRRLIKEEVLRHQWWWSAAKQFRGVVDRRAAR